jgi:hypothetical protein
LTGFFDPIIVAPFSSRSASILEEIDAGTDNYNKSKKLKVKSACLVVKNYLAIFCATFDFLLLTFDF